MAAQIPKISTQGRQAMMADFTIEAPVQRLKPMLINTSIQMLISVSELPQRNQGSPGDALISRLFSDSTCRLSAVIWF